MREYLAYIEKQANHLYYNQRFPKQYDMIVLLFALRFRLMIVHTGC